METLQIKQDGGDMTGKCNTCSQGGTWLEEKMLQRTLMAQSAVKCGRFESIATMANFLKSLTEL